MGMLMTAASLTGLAVATAALFLTGPEPLDGLTAAERQRRRELADEFPVFRWLGLPARELAGLIAVGSPQTMTTLAHRIDLLDLRPRRPEEYLAVRAIQTLAAAIAFGLLAAIVTDIKTGLYLTAGLALIAPAAMLDHLKRKAVGYVRDARRCLPYAIDLMTLVLEAGAGTLKVCLDLAAAENAGNPLGNELRRVLRGLEQGSSQEQQLNEMDRRLADPDFKELVLTLNTAEERGIPLKVALRGQGERIRKRQAQWLEKSAEEAKVHITWPAILVMIACLLILAAPFVLPAIK